MSIPVCPQLATSPLPHYLSRQCLSIALFLFGLVHFISEVKESTLNKFISGISGQAYNYSLFIALSGRAILFKSKIFLHSFIY